MDREDWNQRYEAPDLVRARAERVDRTVQTAFNTAVALAIYTGALLAIL